MKEGGIPPLKRACPVKSKRRGIGHKIQVDACGAGVHNSAFARRKHPGRQ